MIMIICPKSAFHRSIIKLSHQFHTVHLLPADVIGEEPEKQLTEECTDRVGNLDTEILKRRVSIKTQLAADPTYLVGGVGSRHSNGIGSGSFGSMVHVTDDCGANGDGENVVGI
jgi:hypothetical protein